MGNWNPFRTTGQREQLAAQQPPLRDVLDAFAADRLAFAIVTILDNNPESVLSISITSFCEYLCFQLGTTGKGLPMPNSEEYMHLHYAQEIFRGHVIWVSQRAHDLRNFLDWFAQYIRTAAINDTYAYLHYIERKATEQITNAICRVNSLLEHDQCVFRIAQDDTYGFGVHRIGSELLRCTAIKPALKLLRECVATDAVAEYEQALRSWANGDTENAVLKSAHAFEATMKFILCHIPNSSPEQNRDKDNPKSLIQKIVTKTTLLPPAYQSMNEHIIGFLMGVNNVRNNSPGAGHGRAPGSAPPDRDTAELAINLAGTQILYLLRRFLRKRPEARE